MASSSSIKSHSNLISASSRTFTFAGELHLLDVQTEENLATRQILLGHELIIGRDTQKCHWVFDDPQISAKHVRIYTVIFEDEEDIIPLVYAEDLSRNGTYWNGALIGKGNGGFLLSHNDRLRLSSRTVFRFTSSTKSPLSICFDYVQEMEMDDEYVITDKLLGTGSFGRVFMSIKQHTRTQVACKVIDLRVLQCERSQHFSSFEGPSRAPASDQKLQTDTITACAKPQRRENHLEEQIRICCREVEILSRLSHPNIIGISKVYMTNNTIYMFQDLVTAGDLFSYMESRGGKLSEIEVAVIMRQIVLALQFLHAQSIVHRDLKPENIMMTSQSVGCRIVLTDFGASRRLHPAKRMTSIVGTEQYAAPEIKIRTRNRVGARAGYTKAVDMWSIGTITFVLLTGSFAFSDPTTGNYSSVLARKCDLASLEQTTEWHQISSRPKDLISKLLILDEQRRMTASQTLQHDWFTNDFYKRDLEDLYRRTTKNWRCTIPNGPIVEVIEPCDFRNVIPSHLVAKQRDRVWCKDKPIDPPYKPFPRNIHTILWPKRKTARWSMSEEVKTAITENWATPLRTEYQQAETGSIRQKLEMITILKSPTPMRLGRQMNHSTTETHHAGHNDQLHSHNLMRASRDIHNAPNTTGELALAAAEAKEVEMSKPNLPEESQKPTISLDSSRQLQTIPNLPSLRRKVDATNTYTNIVTAKRKGWRDSMFDLVVLTDNSDDDNDEDKKRNYQSTSKSTLKPNKKVKLLDLEESIEFGETVVVIHDPRSMFEEETRPVMEGG